MNLLNMYKNIKCIINQIIMEKLIEFNNKIKKNYLIMKYGQIDINLIIMK